MTGRAGRGSDRILNCPAGLQRLDVNLIVMFESCPESWPPPAVSPETWQQAVRRDWGRWFSRWQLAIPCWRSQIVAGRTVRL